MAVKIRKDGVHYDPRDDAQALLEHDLKRTRYGGEVFDSICDRLERVVINFNRAFVVEMEKRRLSENRKKENRKKVEKVETHQDIITRHRLERADNLAAAVEQSASLNEAATRMGFTPLLFLRDCERFGVIVDKFEVEK